MAKHRPTRIDRHGVRGRTRAAPGRAGPDADLGARRGPAGGGAVRGSRRCRQGRHHQAHHRAAEPAHSARVVGAAGAHRARDDPVVLPALHRTAARGAARSCCSTAAGTTAPASSACWASARPSSTELFMRQVPQFERMLVDDGILVHQVLVLGLRRGAAAPVPGSHRRPHQALEAVPDGPRVAGRTTWTTRGRRTRCSCRPTCPRRQWFVVEADDKRRARLNCIAHLLIPHPVGGSRRRRRRSSSRRASPTAATYARLGVPRGTCPTTPPGSDSNTATVGNRQ